MTQTILSHGRAQAFSVSKILRAPFLLQGAKTETIDQLLTRTAERVKSGEKKGKVVCVTVEGRPKTCEPFKSAKAIVDFLALAATIMPGPEGRRLRTAIQNALDNDPRDFKEIMKLLLKSNYLSDADDAQANDLINLYELTDADKETLRTVRTQP